MIKVMTIVLVVILCAFTALYTINVNSIDNAVNAITQGVFDLSIEIREEAENEIDKIHIIPEKFRGYFGDELIGNLAFYQGEVEVTYYFYNVVLQTSCLENLTCNGVQIRLQMKGFYMFNKIKEYRYEVTPCAN